jgi:hypothetical protein
MHVKMCTTLSELIGMYFLCLRQLKGLALMCSVRAVVKIMGYERGNNTCYLVLFILSSKNHWPAPE